jgi:hypothetical protein
MHAVFENARWGKGQRLNSERRSANASPISNWAQSRRSIKPVVPKATSMGLRVLLRSGIALR